MKNYPSISFRKFRFGSICTLILASFLIFSSISATSQGFYRKKSDRNRGSSKVKWKRNIVSIEGLGSSQVVSAKYERIMLFGVFFSMRFDFGITPFLLDEKYNFIAGKSITPITGGGFYFHIVPLPLRVGLGCSVLHDVFFDRIPEVVGDTSGTYGTPTYRARVMPWVVVEATIKDSWTIKAGYSPIIDPPNHAQTELYFTNWATISVGYKFGK